MIFTGLHDFILTILTCIHDTFSIVTICFKGVRVGYQSFVVDEVQI